MPLTSSNRCQICGDCLFHDDYFSDPEQHFCLTVNGPGMIDPHANGSDIIKCRLDVTTLSGHRPSTQGRKGPRRAESDCNSGSDSDASSSSA
ncbi:hypothetical protein WHR41_00058 [Cladosporium halotolerans]|uniref:Uncharacterized protein n=1 Tax=Cladosporium halotolerans TaxID=1052096 RepID=A0AB34L595_9PEZI